MEHITIDPLHILGVLIGLVAWFTKLEAKGNRNADDNAENKKEIAKLKEKHDTLESKLIDKLSAVEQSLARIEGSLSK